MSCGSREPSGAKMAARIADLVNETLEEEGQGAKLQSSDILELIDSGRSEGGSKASSRPLPLPHLGTTQ